MRRINAILGPVMIILLLIHAITGAFQLASVIPGGSVIRSILSWMLAAFVLVHAVIGIWLTVQTLHTLKKAGRSYFRENGTFWLARISGFALLLFITYHILIFTGSAGEIFRLHSFGGLQLAAHILLIISLILHLVTNIKPLFIALGIGNRTYLRDIMIVLSILMLVSAAAFIYYYLRWNVLWRYGG